MADLYGTTSYASSPSSSATSFPLESEDISNFLQNILHNQSSAPPSSSCMSSKTKHHLHSSTPPPQTAEDRRRLAGSAPECRAGEGGVAVESSSRFNLSDPGGFVNEFGCESEKGLEASNPPPPRSSSKRSRAAEVHNLSEKRRRSRINEKMKALQNLIPNSNKTDKASMLDEAIEYLKQLQLQVQMLSLRNGLSLHPFYLPGLLQPMQLPQTSISFDDANGLVNADRTGTFSTNHEASVHAGFDISNQCTRSNQPIILSAPTNITNSETARGFEPSIQAHYTPFSLSTSSRDMCRDDTLQQLQLDMNCSGKNSSSGVSS